MKVVMILVVRDQADIVDAHIAYHLNAGVDLVLATDHESRDGTTDTLESYAREGYVHLTRESGEAHEPEWRTRMARQAATEHGADWVINSDADEFWWPRGESLKDLLAPIPSRYTIVQGLRRPFVRPRADDELFWAERMTTRASLRHGPNGGGPLTAMLRPLHRGDEKAVVREDGAIELERRMPLRAWYPVEVLHFPVRSPDSAATDEPADALLVEDTRLRDALRTLREAAASSTVPGAFALPGWGTSHLSFRAPDIVDDAAYAVECAAVGEVDLPRLESYVAELEQRVAWLEQRLWPRVLRRLSRSLGRTPR